MIAPDRSEVNLQSRFTQALLNETGSLPQLFMTNNGGFDFNSAVGLSAEIGSGNGVTNARGLAGLFPPQRRIARAGQFVLQPSEQFGVGGAAGVGQRQPADSAAAGMDQAEVDESGHRLGDVMFGSACSGGDLAGGDPLFVVLAGGQQHHRPQRQIGEASELHGSKLLITHRGCDFFGCAVKHPATCGFYTCGYGPQAGRSALAALRPSLPERTCAARLSRITRELIRAVCSAQS